MRRQPVLEKAVVARIVMTLSEVPGLVVRKRHGTVMGMAGDPDLYGSYRGKHFEIEVKRPFDSKPQLTKLQAERQQGIGVPMPAMREGGAGFRAGSGA